MPRTGKQALAWLQVESLSSPSGKLRVQCRHRWNLMAQLRQRPELDSRIAVLEQSPIYKVKQIKSALPPLWSRLENLRKAEHVDKNDAALNVRESWESCWTRSMLICATSLPCPGLILLVSMQYGAVLFFEGSYVADDWFQGAKDNFSVSKAHGANLNGRFTVARAPVVGHTSSGQGARIHTAQEP